MENTNLSKQQQVSEIMRQMLTQAQTAGQYFTNDQIKEMTRKVSAEVDLVHQQTQNQRYGSSHIGATAKDISNVVDRKSGSAGMPRPISYAVFCLKKKIKHKYLTFLIYSHITLTLPSFFINDSATTKINTLSLHDALPIWLVSILPMTKSKK